MWLQGIRGMQSKNQRLRGRTNRLIVEGGRESLHLKEMSALEGTHPWDRHWNAKKTRVRKILMMIRMGGGETVFSFIKNCKGKMGA